MCFGLSAAAVREVFVERVTRLGGQVKDIFEEDGVLLARGVLPHEGEVKPRDKIQSGAAVRFSGSDLWIHPYTLRQVCKNGAIMVRSAHSTRVKFTSESIADEVLEEVGAAIAECAARRALRESLGDMGSAVIEMALDILPYIRRHPELGAYLRDILLRLDRDRDRSRFGLMNAVTSLARDTADPRRRWELEELGGAIAAWTRPPRPRTPLKRELALSL
jgi:hypothetical protein